ncbi:ribose transport system ATP-binding protein [Saccharopolyspora antimicrobica]|uniref:Monosaccharide ABC transporter ATP-binding protein (CUT2 family) n=1 Tax=Saccharopolyspora antimicrobica TaxID=455193 RepID=A0A1I4VF94_9PSEU|nr:sugar ABC transporter ATP-binding protein [Saccharopolyspora antimicrobica]RKT86273.1 monosaccharide ABC transporter ATP-binding protein (CUT2 family) [Saccharopolyspora antimicrobica]SFM99796.1 ribose transport system ATP-binding protein [Saccharopolyspora antimicrobica]
MADDGHLELIGVSKTYPGVRALDAVDFDLRPGEVHVLLGENGAGKSTLIKMIAGAHRPDTGEIRVDGRPVRFHGPEDAERLGIATIHQEMALVPQLTVAENIYLGRPPRRFGVIDRREMRRRAAELIERMGLDLHVDAVVGELGVAHRQLVEIAKALSLDTRFLIMDEPTAVLSRAEVDRLFGIVGDLTAQDVGVVFISHLLGEVAEIGDRVSVLRDGAKVAEVPADTDPDELVRLMVGRTVDHQYPPREAEIGEVQLEVRGLTSHGVLADIGFTARAGEVVGIGGLVGAGRTELVRALFGADGYDEGEVLVGGEPIPSGDIAAARAAGLALVPEDRAGQGLVLGASVAENLGLATLSDRTRAGLVDLAGQRRAAAESVQRLRIRTAGLDQPALTLSGGNQQKIVIGKWLLAQPRVLILDEPTRGIDVGARAEIYELINELARAGTTVLVVSSDLPELLGLSDRVLVLADGRLRGELNGAEATQERVLALAVSAEHTGGESDA